jgi:hypothetical protein
VVPCDRKTIPEDKRAALAHGRTPAVILSTLGEYSRHRCRANPSLITTRSVRRPWRLRSTPFLASQALRWMEGLFSPGIGERLAVDKIRSGRRSCNIQELGGKSNAGSESAPPIWGSSTPYEPAPTGMRLGRGLRACRSPCKEFARQRLRVARKDHRRPLKKIGRPGIF